MLKIVQIVLKKFSGANRNIMLLFNRRKTVCWLLQTIFTDVTFHIFFSLFSRHFIVDVVTFLYGAAFLRYTAGGGDRGIFCLIEHFFYIRQHKEHFLQSLSRTEEKSPSAPVRKDKQRFQTWPARKLSISTLALLKERKFAFYQKGRFHWCGSRDIL